MNSQQVDAVLLALLSELPYLSRLGTCLQIRLADYAAQECGCRSTRQILESLNEEVEDHYLFLLNLLSYYIYECIKYLKNTHKYKQNILEMNEDNLELTLEAALFNMVIFDCSNIFVEFFLEDE